MLHKVYANTLPHGAAGSIAADDILAFDKVCLTTDSTDQLTNTFQLVLFNGLELESKTDSDTWMRINQWLERCFKDGLGASLVRLTGHRAIICCLYLGSPVIW